MNIAIDQLERIKELVGSEDGFANNQAKLQELLDSVVYQIAISKRLDSKKSYIAALKSENPKVLEELKELSESAKLMQTINYTREELY